MVLDGGDYPHALELADESIAACQQAGNRYWLTQCYETRVDISLAQGDATEARHFYQLELEASRQLIDRDPMQKKYWPLP